MKIWILICLLPLLGCSSSVEDGTEEQGEEAVLFTEKPGQPGGLRVEYDATKGEAILTMDYSPRASEYVLFIARLPSEKFEVAGTVAGNRERRIVVGGLLGGAVYAFRFLAKNNVGETENSGEIRVVIPEGGSPVGAFNVKRFLGYGPAGYSPELALAKDCKIQVGAEDSLFIALYHDILKRDLSIASKLSAEDVVYWRDRYKAATDKKAVIRAVVRSAEGLRRKTNEMFLRFLDRPASASALTTVSEYLATTNARIQNSIVNVLASNEYWNNIAEGDARKWVRQTYRRLFGRTAASSEVDIWAPQLDPADRSIVANAIVFDENGHEFTYREAFRVFRLYYGQDPPASILAGLSHQSDPIELEITALVRDGKYRDARFAEFSDFMAQVTRDCPVQ